MCASELLIDALLDDLSIVSSVSPASFCRRTRTFADAKNKHNSINDVLTYAAKCYFEFLIAFQCE